MNLDDIIRTIYLHFPKNIAYDDPAYIKTVEYKRLLSKKKVHLENSTISNNFKEMLIKSFVGYKICDWTDLENYNCYEYRILLHKNQSVLDDDIELMRELNGQRKDLYLFISILAKVYFFYEIETILNLSTKEWSFNKTFNISKYISDNIKEMEKLFANFGYCKITLDIAQKKLYDLDIECVEKGEVKIFHCLFSNIVTL